MKRKTGRQWPSVAALLFLALPGCFITLSTPPASGAPAIVDLRTGNKTVSWNFSDPVDYVTTNVSLAGFVELNETFGTLVHDTDQDFSLNGTWDATNISVSGGAIANAGRVRDAVVNGTFNSSLPWGFVNDTNPDTRSFWDNVSGTGTVIHDRPAPPALHFDELDYWPINNWTAFAGGAPSHTINFLSYDTFVYWEPNASMRFNVDFKSSVTSWVEMTRTGLWNWSLYNAFSAWMNTTYAGPQVLETYIHLEAGASMWDSARQPMTPEWARYDFDISSFTGDPSGITKISIRFLNIRNENNVDIWVDDCWLFRIDNASREARIYQEFTKDYLTDPLPMEVVLSFDYMAASVVNLTDSNLTASIDGSLWTSGPIPIPIQTGWTKAGPYDVSTSLAGRGAFNLSFAISLSLYTPFGSALEVSIDNVTLAVPDHCNGTYESFPIDLGLPAILDNFSFAASSHPDTNVTVEVRGGWSNATDDGSWTPWERHFSTPCTFLNISGASFLQYRLIFNTTNASASASLDRIEFAFRRHVGEGSVRTVDWSPPDTLIGWRRFGANYTVPPSTSVEFYVSNDTGSTWLSVLPGDSLGALGGSNISLMAELETLNCTLSPELFELNVTYEFLGPMSRVIVNPATWSGTADDQKLFTARAEDQWGHPIAPFAPNWTDDDPNGSVDSSGLYRAGREGSWVVCASYLGFIDCANVTVVHGSLVRIEISPTSAFVTARTPRLFQAAGFDTDDNDVPLTDTSWTTDVGNFSSPAPDSALFMAVGVPATGHVWAMHDSLSGLLAAAADVTVTASTAVVIQGLVPNQRYPEDSPPWQLDLAPYLPSGPDPNDLSWFLEDRDDSLYTVLGERSFGHHTLTFYPRDDAFGDDDVNLWLQDRLGAKDSQPLQVSLTPVNDAPMFYDVERIQVKSGISYALDYSPYISDIDTAKNLLILSTDDPSNTKVSGLTVNYTYDTSYVEQTVMVRLRISDGSASFSTIQVIDVVGGDNACPHSIKPLPPVTLSEDIPRDDVFPDILQNYFGDADGDALTFSLGSLQHMTARQWTSPPNYIHVNISSDPNWFGVEYLRVRAKDFSGCFAEQSVEVTVLPVNDPPVLDWEDDVYVKRNLTYELDLTDFVSDVDDDLSALTLAANDSLLANVERFIVRILASYMVGPVTSVPLSLSLSDGEATAWSNITVNIGDNAPPALNPVASIPAVIFDEDTVAASVFDLDSFFIDADGPQQLSYTVTSGNVSVQIDPDNFISLSAAQDWNGQETLHIRASDGWGFVMGRLIVRVLPVNDAPVIDQMPDWDFGAGGLVAVDLRLYVHDVDNSITELLFSTNSPRANVVGYILVLDYSVDGQSETITLTANDTQGQAQSSFNVAINGVPPDDNGEMPLWAQVVWPFSIIILVIVGAAAAVAYNRVLDRRYALEDAFLVGKGERLIIHTTRHARADRDEDTIARMFTAIQSFIRESFKGEGDMRSFQFNDWEILVERGRDFHIAAVFAGEAPETAAESMRNFAGDVDAHFAPVLAVWSGDADELRGLRSFMDAFVAHRKYGKGDWKKAEKKGLV